MKKVAYKLHGGASKWWNRIQATRKRHGKITINSWDVMRRVTFEQFLPSDCQQTLLRQYHHCQQENISVVEYLDEFQELRA